MLRRTMGCCTKVEIFNRPPKNLSLMLVAEVDVTGKAICFTTENRRVTHALEGPRRDTSRSRSLVVQQIDTQGGKSPQAA